MDLARFEFGIAVSFRDSSIKWYSALSDRMDMQAYMALYLLLQLNNNTSNRSKVMHFQVIQVMFLFDSDKPGTSKGERRQSTAKGELLKQRNLKRYINQVYIFIAPMTL
jgi:hypothetical protein